MATGSYVLPPDFRILITGTNGYIASLVVNELLGLGYVVRGTVRSPKPWLNEYFEQKYAPGVFETAIVTTFEDKNIIERVIDGVDGIAHLASDLTFGTDPNIVIP